MLVFFGCFRVILSLVLLIKIEAKVQVENNVYQNVVVSFSSRLSPENPKSLVESVENILEETSSVLQTAIGERIGSVNFLLPQNWNIFDFEISPHSFSKLSPSIVIESLNDSAFGKFPYTLQYGGCGVSGLQITIPDEFLTSEEVYPKSKILAREWLKYQYGVFDENGFPNDSLYPSFFKIPGSNNLHVTDCTSPKVEYTLRDLDNNTCTSMKNNATECLIHPEGESLGNVTSSLMFFHKELPSVNQICGKTHDHNVESLNKHNVLCNYKSIWEVIQSSKEKSVVKVEEDDGTKDDGTIQFSYFQEKLRLVVAWQGTKDFEDKEALIFGVVRKFMYDVPLQSEIGLYYFTNTARSVRPLSELSSDEERIIRNLTPLKSTIENPCPTCVIEDARKDLSSNGNDDHGTIVIITTSNPAKDQALQIKLAQSNLCLVVIGFNGTSEDKWKEFIDTSTCNVFWEIKDSVNEAETFQTLYEKIFSVLPNPSDDTRTLTVKTGKISETIEVPSDPSAKSYSLWIFQKIGEQNFECLTKEEKVTLTTVVDTENLEYFSFEPQLTTVTCKLKDFESSALAQLQMTTKEGAYLSYRAWVHDTTPAESKDQMPVIIFAQLYYGQYPVKNASVTAQVNKKVRNENVATEAHLMNISLIDDGRGDPDITRNDGIYSIYFTEFESEGDYTVTITANDNEKFSEIGKNGEDPCCGSSVVSESVELHPFEVTFYTKFSAISKKPDAGYKPSRVVDLRVDRLNLPHSVTLSWTAPGGEMHRGQAEAYTIKSFISANDVLHKFSDSETGKEINTEPPKAFGEIETIEIKLDEFEDNSTHFFALQTRNDKNQTSQPSNIVSIFIPVGKEPITDDQEDKTSEDKAGTMKAKTIGMIVGLVLLAILIIVCVYLFVYIFFVKPKRRKDSRESGGNNNSSQRNRNGHIGLNSIPADVILKHHSEVVHAKKLHKDPPVFREEDIETAQDHSASSDNESQNNNANYALPDRRDQRTSQDEPKKSPKRMTVV